MSAEHKHSIKRVQTLSHSYAVCDAHIRDIDDKTAAILVVALINGDVCIYRTPLSHRNLVKFHLLKRLHAHRHADGVNTVFIHPTKPLFVTASCDETAKVWDLKSETGPLLIKCIEHPADVLCAKYSPSGLLCTLCAGELYKLGFLSVYGVEPLFKLRWSCHLALTHGIYGFAWSPSNHLAAMYDGLKVRVWDTAFQTIFQHTLIKGGYYYGGSYCLGFASDDLLVCSGGEYASGTLFSCDIPNSTVTAHKYKNGKPVRTVTALSSDIVCVSCKGDTLRVYKVRGTELRLLATLPFNTSHFLANCVCLYKDSGYVLASADWRGGNNYHRNDVFISVTSRFNRYWVQEATKIVLNSTILPFCTDVDKIILQYLR